MAPINADDPHASGDLDAGCGLRLDTKRQPSRALEALVDPEVPLSPPGDQPRDPFAVRAPRLLLLLLLLSSCRSAEPASSRGSCFDAVRRG